MVNFFYYRNNLYKFSIILQCTFENLFLYFYFQNSLRLQISNRIQLSLRQITSDTSEIFILLSLIYKLFIKSTKWLMNWNQLLITWTISEMSR